MTKQESFKQRVRARMATTGERYAAARRQLLREQAPAGRRREWASEPELDDDAIRARTGRGWDDWCDLIDAWPGHVDGHTAVAAWVYDQGGLTHWWAQGVTVGWERITGRRLPHQMADGTFTANKSKTVPVDGDELRAAIVDEDGRSDLFPGHVTELRSKPTSKSLRVRFDVGSVLFTIEPKPDGRSKVTVSHEQLPAAADVAEWKFFWDEWLDALAG